MDILPQDIRYAVRQLLRSPGFTAVAILTLALGMGANTLVYSTVEAVLLRPLPWRDADRLMAVHEASPDGGMNALSYPNFHDWRVQARSFDALAAYAGQSFNLAGGDEPEHVAGARVSATLFPLLGVTPTLGRGFTPEEDQPGAEPVVVLSHALWQSRFGADPAIVGKPVLVDGVQHTVVGVMPPGFAFPAAERLWIPLALDPGGNRDSRWLWGIGRLQPGVTAEQARAELNAIARRLGEQYPETNQGWGAHLESLRESMIGDNAGVTITLLMGAAGFVLLIACANLANLLLARGTGRQREMVIRAALGAGRGRIVRQLLTESLLLALLGGAGGILIAFWGLEAIRAALPSFLPTWIRDGLVIDARVLAFTALLAVGTSFLFGLLPALRATRPDVQQTLRGGGAGAGVSPERGRLGSGLVAAQIALSLVLLSGATLLIRSLLQLQTVDPGFEPQQVVTMRLTLAGPAYESTAERIRFWQTLLSRVDGLPGIEAQGLVGSLPLSGNFSTSFFAAEGHEVPAGQEPSAQLYPTAGDYLRAMQIPLLRGRNFTPVEQWDSAARVVLVNEAVARRLWPDTDPIGQRIRLGSDASSPWYTVIGVVGNVRHAGLANDWTRNQIYFPYGSRARGGISLVARTPMDPMAAASVIRQAVASVDPNLPVFEVRTMGEIYRQSLWEERLNGWLFGSFAVGAFVLAIVGVYGVMAHIVSQRTHEMGVRIALGASARQVSRMILRRALALALGGVAAGIVGALATTRLLAGMLYGVQPTDPVTFISVPLVLAAAALLASYLPARRATRVDPIIALRAE